MQVANAKFPVNVTGRHISITDAMREYALKKVQNIHLDYPRIIEAKVLLDVRKNYQQFAEVVLFCADHITIEADTTTEDIYASIDQTLDKIARRMRKYKTRMLKAHRPKKSAIREIPEYVYPAADNPDADAAEAPPQEPEPLIIHDEKYRIRPLFTDEAIMEMEVSERSFIVFNDAKTHQLSILFRRKDGDYGMIVPERDGGVPGAPGE
ncbi:MAG: ribosome-associated translation inhibitor RaiA [Verrucomicrobiae bacterium]|nr:ribosome-associated translation inhibitor RaiA [Verrucomicrobiae bacterium]MCP5540722.1 ribosome-associated translation inhibitor RaiA [Akkermansiaceae bacterium]